MLILNSDIEYETSNTVTCQWDIVAGCHGISANGNMAMDIWVSKKLLNLTMDFVFKDEFSLRALYLSEMVP